MKQWQALPLDIDLAIDAMRRDDSDAAEIPPRDDGDLWDEAEEIDRDRSERVMWALYRFKQLGGATDDCDLLALEMKRSDDWEDFQCEMANYEKEIF